MLLWGNKMKLKFLNVAVTTALMSASGFSQLAYANIVSTADCQAANTATSGSCITVAQWHNTNDDFGGVKKVTYADDLFLVVSQTGTYDKSASYEMLPGYHWATLAELEERLVAYRAANTDTKPIEGYNYYALGGWTKYAFEGVDRRDFLYADSSVAGRTVYVGHKEIWSLSTKLNVNSNGPAYAASDPATTVEKWAGFVLIKDPEVVDTGETLTVAKWHNTGDDFGGLKKFTFADDMYLAVSDSGEYVKANTYEMLPGYRWATYEEMEERFNAYVAVNGTDALKAFNYHGLGGWTKYSFPNKAGEVVERRNFIFANTAENNRIVYAGVKEYVNLSSSLTTDTDFTDDSLLSLLKWGGLVVIKEPIPEQSVAPSVSLSVEQNGNLTSVIDSESGVVTVTALVTDINEQDTHTVTWDVGGTSLLDLNSDDSDITFEFDTSLLDAGTYTLKVDVVENNTNDSFATTNDVNLVVETSLTTLSADNDADNDGTSDADEGYGDNDQDGIADYLDDDSDTTRLPIDDAQALQTITGLKLSLGDIVRSSDGSASRDAVVNTDDITNNAGDNGASVDNAIDYGFKPVSAIVNFNVSGLATAGETVPVVIPLADGTVIPVDAIYRKYTQAQGWFNFVIDDNNVIKSALKDDSGNCPAPLSADYVDGLVAANNCIELSIEDGGANDADGIVNSVVKDPGVLAIEFNNAPNIVVGTDYTVAEETALSLDASNTTDVESEAMTFLWTQLSGTPVTLSGENSDVLSFTTPSIVVDETLTFQLTVDDGTKSSIENVDVMVTHYNDAPTVSIADHPAESYEALHITLSAQGDDINGDNVSYQWQQISGPSVTLADATAAEISFLAPFVAGDSIMEFSVTASDGVETVSTTTSVQINDRAEVNRRSSGGSISWMLALIALGGIRRKLNKRIN